MKSFYLAPLYLIAMLAFGGAVEQGLEPGPLIPLNVKPENPALVDVADVPGLPRVMLIGDSISVGYTLQTREFLKGLANVHRPRGNCGETARGLANLEQMIGKDHWDLIHFNYGLHDLKYIDEKGTYVPPDKGKQVAPPEAYRKQLRAITQRLKATGAKLVFATTTPVPEGSQGRVAGDEKIYNQVALEVMKELGVSINDLCSFVLAQKAGHPPQPLTKPQAAGKNVKALPGAIQQPSNVHFTPEGYNRLAELVAASIKKELAPRLRTALVEWQFVEDQSPTSSDPNALRPPTSTDWKNVTLPHVFRQSGLPDEAAGWYRQTLHPSESDRGFAHYLFLEGAASVKDVFLNGKYLGRHKGAFSRASFDLTPALKWGQDNTLDVRVSNREEESKNCFSRSPLYFVNGGMFRPAWLIKTGAVHLFPDMGSTGVYLTPTHLTPDRADLNVKAVLRNALSMPATVKVRCLVTAPEGTACGESERQQQIAAGESVTIELTQPITKPKRWDLGQPNLYTVRTLVSVDDKVTDEVIERTGLRTIEWKDKKFYLNGREVQFRGVNKHSQTEYAWNAVDDEETRIEWQSMADLGVNTVRLPHYPHRALEYEIADARGIAVWAENGYAGANQEKEVSPDGEQLTREMVRQNWNHPSILFWSAGNETWLEPVSHYADVIRGEKDPSRLVTYAANAGEPVNCDFVARNTYDGWYGGGHYSQFLNLPKNLLVAESGCGDWTTHHVPYGSLQFVVNEFEPAEYAGLFTEYRLQTVCKNDVANRPMFLWWCFREFYDHKFKNICNTKGLLTMAGTPKDIYFLFQAFLNPSKPVVRLCGKQFFLRSFAPDNGIKAYSNAAELRLTLNGVAQETLANGAYRLPDSEFKPKGGELTQVPGIPVENVFFWKTPLRVGRNVVEVSDGRGHVDRTILYQKPTAGPFPADQESLVQELSSSNPNSPAWFIDRPIEAQGAFYSEVDGSSDNTFDLIPKEIEGASWIATKRLSQEGMQTDLSFRIRPGAKEATVSVLFSTGTYPTVTLLKPDEVIQRSADLLSKSLLASGFADSGIKAVWRNHLLLRADAAVRSRTVIAGERVAIPGQALDYVILIKYRAEVPHHHRE